MPIRRAQRAFLWKFGLSNFKYTYGRYGEDGFTKNYLQTDRSKVRDALVAVIKHSGSAGDEAPLVIKWPGGKLNTKFKIKNSNGDTRGEIYVTTGTTLESRKVTEPFVPGNAMDPSKALVGDGELPTTSDATSLYHTIEASGVKPWYMLVAVEGDEGSLHARMFLENPPSGREHLGLDRQPAAIQHAVRNASADTSDITVQLEIPIRATRIVGEIEDALKRSPNVLLIGPPGCGKTVAIEDMIAVHEETSWFDTEKPDPWVEGARKVYETAFHPSVSYESFVAGLMPKVGRGIELEVRSGPLLNMAQWCRTDGREGLLVVDEFNRGPASAIFGDMLVLLDKGKRSAPGQGGSTIAQPHSDRDLDVPSEFSADAPHGTRVPKRVSLPSSLKILGAFNSSDRSVTPPDAALLRRFSIIRVGPDPQVLAKHLGLMPFDVADRSYQGQDEANWNADDVRRLAVHLLLALNERLEAVVGEDHVLGHALLWEIPTEAGREETLSALVAEFEEKVVGRLRVTLRDKDDQIALILNAGEPGQVHDDGIAVWNEDDSPVGRLVGPKLGIRNLKHEPFTTQLRSLLSVVRAQP